MNHEFRRCTKDRDTAHSTHHAPPLADRMRGQRRYLDISYYTFVCTRKGLLKIQQRKQRPRAVMTGWLGCWDGWDVFNRKQTAKVAFASSLPSLSALNIFACSLVLVPLACARMGAASSRVARHIQAYKGRTEGERSRLNGAGPVKKRVHVAARVLIASAGFVTCVRPMPASEVGIAPFAARQRPLNCACPNDERRIRTDGGAVCGSGNGTAFAGTAATRGDRDDNVCPAPEEPRKPVRAIRFRGGHALPVADEPRCAQQPVALCRLPVPGVVPSAGGVERHEMGRRSRLSEQWERMLPAGGHTMRAEAAVEERTVDSVACAGRCRAGVAH
eukprot:scaffold32301_cov135-Isochrysis_galbana.AAC.8